jgi:hypothetical protein
MRMGWALLALAACEPAPGEPGYSECSPVQAGDKDCYVWVCFEAETWDQVSYWVEWDSEGRAPCPDSDCSTQIERAWKEGCFYDAP